MIVSHVKKVRVLKLIEEHESIVDIRSRGGCYFRIHLLFRSKEGWGED